MAAAARRHIKQPFGCEAGLQTSPKSCSFLFDTKSEMMTELMGGTQGEGPQGKERERD